jgi:hypothetical protein
MNAANPNPMEKSMVSVLVVANAGGGLPLPCGITRSQWGYRPHIISYVFSYCTHAITLRLQALMIQSINQSINHAISITPPPEMPPKHRQLRAPCPKASGNAFQALVDPPNDGNNLSFDRGDENTDGSDDNTVVTAPPGDSGPPASPNTPNKRIAIRIIPHSNGDPPPAFATTSSETIDYSIGFGFAALIYVSLEPFREFYVDFVDIRPKIRVFTRFRLPHHAKCRPNIANSAPHAPKPLGTRSKLLWTLRKMEITFPSMEEMKTPMEVMTTPL